MCGILGLYNLSKNIAFDSEKFDAALLKMKYRGPDAHASKQISDSLVFGHLRLSIIDLKAESNQPFQIDERYWITFNGEIYNYLELRAELITEGGYTFRTASDTEVLLRAYQHWGENCVNKFNGMWAFGIYDKLENKLFCSRDRFGVKPLNYAFIDGQFIFASEIKAILSYFPQLKQANYNAIANYCRTSVGAQHEETWFNDVFRLQPAHNLVITEGSIKQYRYWQYPTKIDKSRSFEQAKTEYGELFLDAVKLRMRSDVPVGTTLSSGVDSNSIVYTLRQFYQGEHHTFTAAFDSNHYDELDKQVYANDNQEIDETDIVRQSVKDLNLTGHIIETDYTDFIDGLQKIIFHLESGHSSSAVFPLMQVMEKAREEVTVIMEGQGADELLGYQQTLFIAAVIEHIKSFEFKEALQTIRRTIKTYSFFYALMMYFRQLSNKYPIISTIYQSFTGINKVFTNKLAITKRLKDYPNNANLKFDSYINSELYKQHSGGLVNLLHYGDAISMAHSLESRLPFMDFRLVEFGFKLPWYFKLHIEYAKYIHRQAMKGIVPDSILDTPLKFGFNTPISQFFKKDAPLKVKPLDILLSDRCLSRHLFNKSGLEHLIEEHEKGVKNHSTLLYRLLSTELWFREFMDK